MYLEPCYVPAVPFYKATEERTTAITPEVIINKVLHHFRVPREKVFSPCRKRVYVLPRHVAMTYLTMHTDMTLCEIAQMFGKADHSTTWHARNAIRDLYDTDKEFKEDMSSLLPFKWN